MKRVGRIVGLVVMLTAGLGVTVATAATVANSAAWTESKAEKVVLRDARVQVEPVARATIEDELRREVARFRGLELLALEEADQSVWWTYHNWGNRYQDLLQAVRSGLRIDLAACAGAGRSVGGTRFRQFDCHVTSEVRRIPSTELEAVDGGVLPAVVEGESRDLGPLFSQLRVTVTGKSTFQYR
jgi:hypothetical protein